MGHAHGRVVDLQSFFVYAGLCPESRSSRSIHAPFSREGGPRTSAVRQYRLLQRERPQRPSDSAARTHPDFLTRQVSVAACRSRNSRSRVSVYATLHRTALSNRRRLVRDPPRSALIVIVCFGCSCCFVQSIRRSDKEMDAKSR